MQLGQVILFVHDLERMKAFYTGAFQMSVLDEQDGFVRLSDGTGGAVLALHKSDAVGAPTGNARKDTATKMCFFVADVEAAKFLVRSQGAKPGELKTFGEITIWDTTDPEDNVIQLTNRRLPGNT